MLGGVSDPDCQGEIELLFLNRREEEYVHNKENP